MNIDTKPITANHARIGELVAKIDEAAPGLGFVVSNVQVDDNRRQTRFPCVTVILEQVPDPKASPE